jgi:hypothetical protein
MNIQALTRVRDQILAAPNSIDMGVFIQSPINPICLTIGCIAGWLLLNEGYTPKQIVRMEPDEIVKEATRIADITPEQAESLFFGSQWPKPFLGEYMMLDMDEDQSDLVARVIDSFIEDPGKFYWFEKTEGE